jgi:polyhydroxyalkanoate synthesis regulator phasin
VYKVEKEPVTSEEENKEESSENGREKMNEWFTENLRMIVSVVIVVVIAGGIYSYSKRAQAPNTKSAATSTEQSSEGKISVIGGDNQAANDNNQQAAPEAAAQPQNQTSENVQAAQPQTSQETGTSFVETAAKGEGSTNLARRSLANYLEKNPDSSLTAEHKIYIEDLLRRQVKDGRMKIGDKREFTKDMIAKAIEKSKSLNDKQLKNLQKYSHRVSALK